jgi:hypothetical protein
MLQNEEKQEFKKQKVVTENEKGIKVFNNFTCDVSVLSKDLVIC